MPISDKSLTIGLLVLLVSLVGAYIVVQAISNPLKALAEKAEKVGAGDYTIRFIPDSDDAIGQLTASMRNMVEKGNAMLNDIITSSQTSERSQQ